LKIQFIETILVNYLIRLEFTGHNSPENILFELTEIKAGLIELHNRAAKSSTSSQCSIVDMLTVHREETGISDTQIRNKAATNNTYLMRREQLLVLIL
jgi:hypothetical protein